MFTIYLKQLEFIFLPTILLSLRSRHISPEIIVGKKAHNASANLPSKLCILWGRERKKKKQERTPPKKRSRVGAEQLKKMQQMQTGEAVASHKRHKRGSDANPGASGNHYCLCAVPSAFPGTYQTQNGAQGLMIMS